MSFGKISTMVSALLALTFVPAYAGPQGKSGSHGPTAKTTHGPSSTGASAKPVKASKPQTTKAETRLAKADTSSTASISPTSTSTTSTIDFTGAPVGQKLSRNNALRSKLESRLTALGYTGTSYQAAYGFKNLGQFVAATNVSQNLGIPFEQLKVQMTGLSVNADGTVLKANIGTDGKVTMVAPADITKAAPTKSLGQAIQTVKSTVDATAEAQAATTQADADIKSTSTTVSR